MRELFDERVDLGDGPGRANVGHKAMTVIHAVLAGAEFIDGCDVLRAGSTAAVLGIRCWPPRRSAPSCAAFRGAMPASSMPWPARRWPGRGRPAPAPIRPEAFTIDLDSSIHETYGTQKEGGSRSVTPMCAATTRCMPSPAMTARCCTRRLRGGNSHTARGAVGFLAETFARVRAAGVTGQLMMRADSGFYSAKVVQACQAAGVRFSITVKLYPNVHAAISTIPDKAWKPIPYWLDDGADVAAIDWRAFKSGTDEGIACRLVVRRTRPTPGSNWPCSPTSPTTPS